MTLAAFSLALWLGTIGAAAGVVVGYKLRQREEKRSS